MGFSRQECWSGLPFPSPGILPNPGIEPASPALQTDSLPLSDQGSPNTPIQNKEFKNRKIKKKLNLTVIQIRHENTSVKRS